MQLLGALLSQEYFKKHPIDDCYQTQSKLSIDTELQIFIITLVSSNNNICQDLPHGVRITLHVNENTVEEARLHDIYIDLNNFDYLATTSVILPMYKLKDDGVTPLSEREIIAKMEGISMASVRIESMTNYSIVPIGEVILKTIDFSDCVTTNSTINQIEGNVAIKLFFKPQCNTFTTNDNIIQFSSTWVFINKEANFVFNQTNSKVNIELSGVDKYIVFKLNEAQSKTVFLNPISHVTLQIRLLQQAVEFVFRANISNQTNDEVSSAFINIYHQVSVTGTFCKASLNESKQGVINDFLGRVMGAGITSVLRYAQIETLNQSTIIRQQIPLSEFDPTQFAFTFDCPQDDQECDGVRSSIFENKMLTHHLALYFIFIVGEKPMFKASMVSGGLIQSFVKNSIMQLDSQEKVLNFQVDYADLKVSAIGIQIELDSAQYKICAILSSDEQVCTDADITLAMSFQSQEYAFKLNQQQFRLLSNEVTVSARWLTRDKRQEYRDEVYHKVDFSDRNLVAGIVCMVVFAIFGFLLGVFLGVIYPNIVKRRQNRNSIKRKTAITVDDKNAYDL